MSWDRRPEKKSLGEMSSPRVCVLTTSFPRTAHDDAGIFVGRLVDAFSDVGVTGQVIVPRDSTEPECEHRASFTVSRYSYGLFAAGNLAFGSGIVSNLRSNPFLVFQVPGMLIGMLLAAWTRREEWDVLHANWFVSGIVAALLTVVTKKPAVLTLRGTDMKLVESSVLKPVVSWVLARMTQVVSVNDAFRKTLEVRFPSLQGRLQTIPNGVAAPGWSSEQVQALIQEKQIDTSKKIVLFVSRLIPLKRIELLIEACADERLQGCQLLLVGRSEEEYEMQLRSLVDRLELAERVRFVGQIRPDQIGALLSVADVFATASSWEGRSNSLAEAMAFGLPVVASDIPGHSELVVHEQCGLLVPGEEGRGYANAIHLLVSNEAQAQEFSSAARKAMSECSWPGSAERYRALFLECG